MLVTAKTLTLIEQKRLQWAREREEMVGLYGLWGRPRNLDKNENNFLRYNRNNLLPPIEGKIEFEEQNKAEESETSGYLSDSSKHLNEKESNQERNYIEEFNEQLNNGTLEEEQQCWNKVNSADQENYWAEKKMFKNYKNENWAHQNSESYNHQRFYQMNRNLWQGTPDSLSSDDGNRLRWGDRGVGIGHLWEPVINHPDCRLPLVHDSYRQTPKWVEKGLKNSDGNKADILIINHPDDNKYDLPQKNYLLGQNVPIPPEIIEERERKRKKALEHQNAIKKQLEEREMKRKQEKENRIREERLEEERIRKEQEIERLRYEEEQRKIKQKEEIEKKKEEVMREAIEVAEKLAKEEKRLSKKHLISGFNEKSHLECEKKFGKISEHQEGSSNFRKQIIKTPRYKKIEEKPENQNKFQKENSEKTLKDSFSQSEEIALAQNFQLLNVNGLPVDGGLAFMLDTPPKDKSFLLPPDGVQLALFMSPRNVSSANPLMINSPPVSISVNTGERILTPSKYRAADRLHIHPASKSTQTELKYSPWVKNAGTTGRREKQTRRWGANSGSSGTSQKCNNEGPHKRIPCFLSSKYRSKPFSSKMNLENRPKWGINRPSVQYKKQSEKDPYYQKKLKERLKKTEVGILSIGEIESADGSKDKEMNSVVRLLDCQTDEEEKQLTNKEEILLRNGYRMNSNLSSPVFVPIASGMSEWEKSKKLDLDSTRSRSNDSEQFDSAGNEDGNDDEENLAVPGSVGFLTLTQLKAIKQIASLREGLIKLQNDYSNSRSITPFSDRSLEKFSRMIKLDDFLTKKKEPAQALDLSKVKITSKEEFKKYLDKIPDCKVKPEKILLDHIKIKDKEFSFVSGKKEEKQGRDWSYPDPTPPDMRGVKLEDLCPVNIDWKMLTTLRPKTKMEEDMFSRLVQLGKLDLKYQQALKREKITDWVKKTKNPKSSIVEVKILSCKECGEDFCDSSMCSKLMYDYFFRPQATTSAPITNLLLTADTAEPKKKKRKKKGKHRKTRKKNVNKSRRKKLGKNSIFNRPLSRGCNRDHFRRTVDIAEKPRVRALSSTRNFSTERMRTRANFFERRSKSAPKIHFEGDILNSKSKRYLYTSDSGPSQSDYSSHSDSESPDSRGRFFPSHLRLSGRRKLLSARVGFSRRNQVESPFERQGSQFVRKCTLYKGYHSDASAMDSQGDIDTSESSPSKSPEKSFKSSFPAKFPSTVRIQFDEDFETPLLKFPDKIFLPNKMANARPKSKDVPYLKNHELKKIAEGFSKIELEFDEKLAKTSKILPQRPKPGVCTHISRSRESKLSKFSGPYLKAKGLFEKKKME